MLKEKKDIQMIQNDIDVINNDIAEIKIIIINLKDRLKYERPPYGNPEVAYLIQRDIEELNDEKDYFEKLKVQKKKQMEKIQSKRPKKTITIIAPK